MTGYWNAPEATAEAVRDGWLHTGDVGHLDEEGWLYVVDRIKDLIIRNGFNVYPRDVEDVLLAHPDVTAAAVVGPPGPGCRRGGRRLRAARAPAPRRRPRSSSPSARSTSRRRSTRARSASSTPCR